MDYNALLLLAADLGAGLMKSGAETYRVEESMRRLLLAYGVAGAEPFVIPNCIIVTLITPQGESKTLTRRIPNHGTDVELLEGYNSLCRRLCAAPLPLEQAQEALEAVAGQCRRHSPAVILLSYLLGTAFFCLFSGGTPSDALCAGLCGVIVGVSISILTALHTNIFLKTMICSALAAFSALLLTALGLAQHSDLVTIGAFMSLVPGLMFTSAIRDVMVGDLVAGLCKLAESLLAGAALALGAALAVGAASTLWAVHAPAGPAALSLPLSVLFALLGCGSFFALYNIHSPVGTLICALGGALGALTELALAPLLPNDLARVLLAAIVISAYAEIMARLRKAPVTGYQLLALFPLVPGAGIYYTMEHALWGDVDAFLTTLLHVLGVAGALAVGVLLVSSAARTITALRRGAKEVSR